MIDWLKYTRKNVPAAVHFTDQQLCELYDRYQVSNGRNRVLKLMKYIAYEGCTVRLMSPVYPYEDFVIVACDYRIVEDSE